MPGGVHDDVDAAEARSSTRSNAARHLVLVGDVAAHGHGGPAGLDDRPDDLLGLGGAARVQHGDRHPVRGEPLAHDAADAAGTAGDHGDPRVGVLQVVRS